jgi:hypothetical protein
MGPPSLIDLRDVRSTSIYYLLTNCTTPKKQKNVQEYKHKYHGAIKPLDEDNNVNEHMQVERSPIYPPTLVSKFDYNFQLYFGSIFKPEFYKPFGIEPSTLF